MLRCPIGSGSCRHGILNIRNPRSAIYTHFNMHHKTGDRYAIKVEGSHNNFLYLSYPSALTTTDTQGEDTFTPELTNTQQEADPQQETSHQKRGASRSMTQPSQQQRNKRQKTFPKNTDPHGPHVPSPLKNLDRLRPSFDKDKQENAPYASQATKNDKLPEKPPAYAYPSREDKLSEALKVMFSKTESKVTTTG